MSTATGYIRVSTADQASNGVSLEAQREKIESYCDLYDLELVDVKSDQGASGKTLDREGLRNALQQPEAGMASTLVVVKSIASPAP